MTRDVLIALISKDIKELELLTSGFAEMTNYPAPYMQLAINKTNELLENISKLANISTPEILVEKIDIQQPKEIDTVKDNLSEIIVEEKIEPIIEELVIEPIDEILEESMEEEKTEEIIIEQEKEHFEIEDTHSSETVQNLDEELVVDKVLERENEVKESEEITDEKIDVVVVEANENQTLVENIIEECLTSQSKEEIHLNEEPEVEVEEEHNLLEEVLIENTREEEVKEDDIIEEQTEEEHKPTMSVADSIKTTKSLLESLHQKEDQSFASTMAKQKIADLKNALTIADRFRFQRELFAGNGGKMMQAISDLNEMDSIDKAIQYINKNYSWNMDDANVKDFFDLLNRRFI